MTSLQFCESSDYYLLWGTAKRTIAFPLPVERGTSQDGTNFKAAELYRTTLFNSGFFVKIDSLTPTRGAGERGVGGGGHGWGL